jgi:chemotaxis protein methyltransferase CheR
VKLSNQQFDRTRRLALRLAGIELVERHRELLGSRSRRLGILDAEAFDSLLGAAEDGEAAASQEVLCLLTTKFTAFFRHPSHFEVAAEHALQAAGERGRARLWSAAAATGEEPYSLAMALIEAFQRGDPPADILATDVAADALAAAERGEYGDAALRELASERRERFLKPTGVAGRWGVAPAVRRLVEFRALNLASESWPVEGPFDVIFCRNALMYLEASHRHTALERMASLLAPDGLLLLDPAEHLGKAAHLFTPDAGGIYRRRRSRLPTDD